MNVSSIIDLDARQLAWIGDMAHGPLSDMEESWNLDSVIQKRYIENADLRVQLAYDLSSGKYEIHTWE